MDRSPLVSVVLPTFNRSSYLRQAIDSVLDQTYPNLEILVLDDGSTDDTQDVVQAIDDLRVVYRYQDNAGRSVARNHGLEMARGAFIALLDDDDLYLPDKLALQVGYLEANPAVDLVGSGTQVVDAHGHLLRVRRTWEDQPELSLRACLVACPLLTCAVLFRRQALHRLDQWFDPALDQAEDTDFFVRLLLAGGRMAWLPEIVSAYRLHPASSRRSGARYGRSYRRLLDKVYSHSDLPREVLAERDKLYAHYYLVGACHACTSGLNEEGRAELAQALALRPDLVRGHPPPLAAIVAAFADSDIVDQPHAFIDVMCDGLPPELARLGALRAAAHSALHLQQVFSAGRAGRQIPISHWLRGVARDPRWLLNRGIWSILLRALRGLHAA